MCLKGLQVDGRGKVNDKEWIILKLNASVYEDSITYYTVNCLEIGERVIK
jgi:hypothetical protein